MHWIMLLVSLVACGPNCEYPEQMQDGVYTIGRTENLAALGDGHFLRNSKDVIARVDAKARTITFVYDVSGETRTETWNYENP